MSKRAFRKFVMIKRLFNDTGTPGVVHCNELSYLWIHAAKTDHILFLKINSLDFHFIFQK